MMIAQRLSRLKTVFSPSELALSPLCVCVTCKHLLLTLPCFKFTFALIVPAAVL